MGAVIFVDFWLIRKFGLQSSYAELSKRTFNWAAGLAWLVTLTFCLLLVKLGWIIDKLVAWGVFTMSDRLQWIKDTFTVQIFFVSLPGWFVAAVLYIVLSKFYQKKVRPNVAQ
jgi:TRAP-type C4-dicarboxylate transport system permease small subunit